MWRLQFIHLFIILFSVPAWSQTTYPLNTSNNAKWKIYPVDKVTGSVSDMSNPEFDISQWIPATVPGTFFVDYVNAGVEDNPDFGDNIYRVDETKYNKAHWYRLEFEVPENFVKDKLWLNFDGVNKEGVFYLNGQQLGQVKGFMLRSKYDITTKVKAGKNVILVKVDLPDVRRTRASAGPFDSWANFAMPTFMGSAGWDWMPYVPGLNCGITNDVYLTTTGSVALADTWIRSDLPDTTQASISIQTTVKNLGNEPVDGILKGTVMPGNISFSKNITIEAGDSETIKIDKDEFSQLIINNPQLWWPNGYGTPNLYACDLEFAINNEVSDQQKVTFGIRKYEYKTENGAFTLYVNGSKVFIRGGNWGMTEYLQRSKGKDYDTRIKLHADMNFNMIRLWTGCVTDDEFYQYCDKYGIMVWDDFWFHGNIFPPSQDVFMSNAIDKIKRLRNHACIAVWCGANEGVPPDNLDPSLKQAVANYDGNDRFYQSASNAGNGVSGGGPYTNQNPKTYFSFSNSGVGAGTKPFSTEIGTATFTTFESFKEFMPESSWWPARNEMWNKHFFGKQAENAGTDNYYNTVNSNYGISTEIDEFCEKSQYLNLEVMKAIYEGWNDNIWDNASGVLIWMSQPAYPSFVWQTYDYYYDATGAYWGAKKACEPVHIQWNYVDNSVKVINTTLNDYTNLTAKATVYNLNGEIYKPLCMKKTINSLSNTATECFVLAENSDLNLALKKPAYGSVNNNDKEGVPSRAVDGNMTTRWGSGYQDNAWFYVDLGKPVEINKVKIYWEAAYGRNYLIQVSDDAENWTTVYTRENGAGGNETLTFDPVVARYIKLQGVKRGTSYGYSFWEFEVYAPNKDTEGNNVELSVVNFIRLELTDSEGNPISDNFYWRNKDKYDYQALNTLPFANVSLTQIQKRADGKCIISCDVINNSSTVAFGNRLKVINKQTGKRVLPIYMNDNFFTLMPGESKNINIEFDESLVGDAGFKVVLKQYGNYDSNPDLSIKEVGKTQTLPVLKIYPNPVSESLKLEVNSLDLQEVKIFNFSGKLIYAGYRNTEIDVSHLPKGFYLLQAIVRNQTYSEKFIKK